MKSYQQFFKESLESSKEEKQLRTIQDKVLPEGCIDFGSSDYLGLASQDPQEAFANINHEEKQKSNIRLGSSGSRLTTGTYPIHLELEQEIAKWQTSEAALIFSTGYAANVGALSCILNSRDVVYMDELSHASLRDGVRLSKAKKYFFRHNDAKHLEELIRATRKKSIKSLIITESIFSMDGDKAKLSELQKLAEKYQSSIYLDEAHATGILGKTGAGLCEELEIDNNSKSEIIKMGSLSKAIGIDGAFIAGSQELIDFLVNYARTFVYSISPSPLTSQLILKNIKQCIQKEELRSKLNSNIQIFRDELTKIEKASETSITWSNENTPIFAVYLGDSETTLTISNKLKDMGFRVPAIRPPTVDKARLRICINAYHSPDKIKELASLLLKFK